MALPDNSSEGCGRKESSFSLSGMRKPGEVNSSSGEYWIEAWVSCGNSIFPMALVGPFVPHPKTFFFSWS